MKQGRLVFVAAALIRAAGAEEPPTAPFRLPFAWVPHGTLRSVHVGSRRDAGSICSFRCVVGYDDGERRDRPCRLKVAWFYELRARSGAGPLVIGDGIYFDGDRASPFGAFAPRFFAVRDDGSSARLLWEYELGGPTRAVDCGRSRSPARHW